MTRLMPALLVTALLAACGVDGEPTRPEQRPTPGLTVSGTAEFGIAGSGR